MPQKPNNRKPNRDEQGALGDLMSQSAGSTPIADSNEVLNPARRTPTQGTPVPSKETASAAPVPPPASLPAPIPAPAIASTPTPALPPITTENSSAPIFLSQAPASRSAIDPQRWPLAAAAAPKTPDNLSSTALLWIALFMSLLIHATIGVVLGKAHIGAVDVSLLQKDDRPFLVKLPAKDDPIYSDPVLTAAGFGLGSGTEGPPGSATTPAQTTSEVSKMMLLSRSTPPTSIAANTTQGPVGTGNSGSGNGSATADLIEQPDIQPAKPQSTLIDDSPRIDLPSDVVSKLAGGATVELPATAGGGAKLPGSPAPTGNEGPSTSTQARSLLKLAMPTGSASGAGFNAAGSVTIPTPTGPVIGDAAPKIDRRLLDSTPTAPPLEVAAIALSEARHLDVPEKLDDDFDYLVTKFRPEIGGGLFQSAKPDRYSYFKVDITAKRSLRKLKTMPKDVIFLLDTSGSVPQEWVNAMTSGVRDALNTLNEGDRFNIVFFNEKTSLFSEEKIAPADSANIAAAQKFLTGANSKGNTDINRSLSRLLQRDTSAQRAYYLVFISDGVPTQGVMDTRELINLVTRDNDLAASIYCVGVANSQNKELLNFLAYRNKGSSTFAKNPADAAAAIRDLVSRIRYPIIKDVSLNVIGLDFEEVFPHNLPNIHQGEIFSVYGRYERGGAFTMRVGGHNGLKSMDVTFGGDLGAAKTGRETIPDEWAFWKLHHIYSEIIREGAKPELKAKIDELKQRFDLKTLY